MIWPVVFRLSVAAVLLSFAVDLWMVEAARWWNVGCGIVGTLCAMAALAIVRHS